MSYQGVLLYVIDPASTNAKQIRPVTVDDLSGGSASGAGATAANQAEVIARLNTLLGENATEAEQQDIEAAIVALQNAWLAENATEAKQDELIAVVNDLKNAIAPTTLTDPDFIVTNVDGVVAAGAKAIKFTIPAGTTLTVKGKSVPTDLATLEWQFNPGGYSEVPYTVSGGQVIITFSR